jgi:hypothetical protein
MATDRPRTNIGALPVCSLLWSVLALPNALAVEYTLMAKAQYRC